MTTKPTPAEGLQVWSFTGQTLLYLVQDEGRTDVTIFFFFEEILSVRSFIPSEKSVWVKARHSVATRPHGQQWVVNSRGRECIRHALHDTCTGLSCSHFKWQKLYLNYLKPKKEFVASSLSLETPEVDPHAVSSSGAQGLTGISVSPFLGPVSPSLASLSAELSPQHSHL